MERGPRRSPVISVGNLAMGGRGKTPTVACIARLLVAAGERPAILSRGYRRREPVDGVVVVSDGRHRLADLAQGGDEPLMLARQVPGAAVLVCEVRAIAAALAEEILDATVHVLDDGFQHQSLRRDIDVVIVTPPDLAGRRLPFGTLRSPVTALRAAHAVVVDGAVAHAVEGALSQVIDRTATAVFTMTRRLGTPWWLDRVAGLPLAHPGTPVVAVAGIAQPERFARALDAAGWTVAELLGYRDHHPYTARDLVRMGDAVSRHDAQVILTTEKDAMRLLPLRPTGLPLAAVPLEVTIEPAHEFQTWIAARLREVRACAQ